MITNPSCGPARLLPVLLLTWSLGACATGQPFGLEAVSLPYEPDTQPRNDLIVHARTGTVLEREQLLDILSDSRVVYISESHDSLAAHDVQAAVLEGLARRHPGRLAVGLEMFPASVQAELDRFNAGELDEKQFQKLWAASWNVDSDYYRSVLAVVRQHGLPLIGLNADKDVVGRIAGHGLGDLPGDVAAGLPDIDRNDPYQRAFLEGIFAGHGKGSGMLDRFLFIQNLWEETMAETAAAYLASDAGRGRHLVILAGGHHVDYGFGIPRRLFRRRPLSYAMVRPEYISLEAVPPEDLMDVETPDLPLPATDFYWYVEYREPDIRHVRLGVYIRPATQTDGIEVIEVLADTPAADAGIQAGDILVGINGERLRENFDLTWQLRQIRPGGRATVDLLRSGDRLSLPLEFPED